MIISTFQHVLNIKVQYNCNYTLGSFKLTTPTSSNKDDTEASSSLIGWNSLERMSYAAYYFAYPLRCVCVCVCVCVWGGGFQNVSIVYLCYLMKYYLMKY